MATRNIVLSNYWTNPANARTYSPGETVEVEEQTAWRMVNYGLGYYTGDPTPDPGRPTGAREIELDRTSTHIRWRYTDSTTWTDLVPLSAITGERGQQGIKGETGTKGDKGEVGNTGATGRGVTNAVVNGAGELVLTYSDNATVNVGRIVGAQGVKGDTGTKGDTGSTGLTGPAGRGVSSASINGAKELVVTYSDGATANLGVVVGTNGTNGTNGQDGRSVTIAGQVASASALPTGLGAADAGKGYVAQDTGNLHVWSGTAFTDVGPVRGPVGPAGPEGTISLDFIARVTALEAGYVLTTVDGAPQK